MWSPVGPHVQWNLSNVVTVEQIWDLMYSGTSLMWSPVGPHVQWNLSDVITYWTLWHLFNVVTCDQATYVSFTKIGI